MATCDAPALLEDEESESYDGTRGRGVDRWIQEGKVGPCPAWVPDYWASDANITDYILATAGSGGDMKPDEIVNVLRARAQELRAQCPNNPDRPWETLGCIATQIEEGADVPSLVARLCQGLELEEICKLRADRDRLAERLASAQSVERRMTFVATDAAIAAAVATSVLLGHDEGGLRPPPGVDPLIDASLALRAELASWRAFAEGVARVMAPPGAEEEAAHHLSVDDLPDLLEHIVERSDVWALVVVARS